MAGPNGVQYIDVSQDQSFPAGSFQGAGPLNSGVSSYKWSNLKANTAYFYRINQRQNDGTWKASVVKSFQARCGAGGSTAAATSGNYNPNMYGSNDKLTIPGLQTGQRCGSQAPVNVRDVPPDAQLGDPSTDCDVIRYDFKLFPGYGGYPGEGGATVIAGHVDYNLASRGEGTGSVFAVGWYWRTLKEGDTIQYIRGDGKTVTYKVAWNRDILQGSGFDWTTVMKAGNQESLALITCTGNWMPELHEYDKRNLVYALRVS